MNVLNSVLNLSVCGMVALGALLVFGGATMATIGEDTNEVKVTWPDRDQVAVWIARHPETTADFITDLATQDEVDGLYAVMFPAPVVDGGAAIRDAIDTLEGAGVSKEVLDSIAKTISDREVGVVSTKE